MAGSLSIPNTLNQLSGTQPLSVIDTNFTTIASYVNNREIASGALGSRPAAAIAGRFYFATDDRGGTLYLDTGAAWLTLAASVAMASIFPFAWVAGATGPGGGTTNFMGPAGLATTEGNQQIALPIACTVSTLSANSSTSPTAGQTYTYTIRKNAVDTTLTCQTAAAATASQDGTHSVSFAANDLITLKVVTSAGAAVAAHNATVKIVPA